MEQLSLANLRLSSNATCRVGSAKRHRHNHAGDVESQCRTQSLLAPRLLETATENNTGHQARSDHHAANLKLFPPPPSKHDEKHVYVRIQKLPPRRAMNCCVRW
jgi:hypothetical protein